MGPASKPRQGRLGCTIASACSRSRVKSGASPCSSCLVTWASRHFSVLGQARQALCLVSVLPPVYRPTKPRNFSAGSRFDMSSHATYLCLDHVLRHDMAISSILARRVLGDQAVRPYKHGNGVSSHRAEPWLTTANFANYRAPYQGPSSSSSSSSPAFSSSTAPRPHTQTNAPDNGTSQPMCTRGFGS